MEVTITKGVDIDARENEIFKTKDGAFSVASGTIAGISK
jgi:hypothetical protein